MDKIVLNLSFFAFLRAFNHVFSIPKKSMFNDSIFVPCPQGNFSMETCRLCEALQVGALPIVEKHEIWKTIYGDDHPLIQIDSWSEVPKIIEDLMRDPIALENKRQYTYKWWIDHLAKIQQKVVDLL